MDSILYWNDVSLEANRVSHTNGKGEQTGPTLSSRALAIVHLAMYDAIAGVAKNPNFLPYLTGLPSPKQGASADAAVALAAYTTLSSLFPSQKSYFDTKLSGANLLGPGVNEGSDFGRIVAQAILDDRKNDPDAKGDGYVPSNSRGKHRHDPDNPEQQIHGPFYGAKSKAFAVTARHGLNPPPKLESNEYINALREVRSKGIAPELMGIVSNATPSVPPFTLRTADETVIGTFWGYDGSSGVGTPPRFYNQIVREIAKTSPNPKTHAPNTPIENARLFALINVAMADAGILAWEQKFIHNFWRPVLGIREHDISIGPAANTGKNDLSDDCNCQWLPFGAPNTNSTKKNFTPPFPAYPSGHATFGAAAFHITRLFYGIPAKNRSQDNLLQNLSFVSDELNGVNKDNIGTERPRHVRNFPRGLWQMILENGRSRVYLGVHWVFDAFPVDSANNPVLDTKIGGVDLGLTIAEDIFASGMTKSSVPPTTP